MGDTENPTNGDVKIDAQIFPKHENNNAPIDKVTKETFRKEVWDHMQKNRISSYPLPVYGRIPNFKGSKEAAAQLHQLQQFVNAKSIEVNPDTPLEQARILVLENDKELYIPVSRLKEHFLKKLSKDDKNPLTTIVRRWGQKHLGVNIDLDDKIHIDLIVVGSVAVSKDGHRIGKGKGYADLEFAILKDMQAIDDSTVIVTIVHDCQVFDELPKDLFTKCDVPVDYILTPTKIIKVEKAPPRPPGIYWDMLSNKRVNDMNILQKLREKHEKEGKDVTLRAEDSDAENFERNRFKPKRLHRRRPRTVSATSEEKENTSIDGNKTNRLRRRSRYIRRSTSNRKREENPNLYGVREINTEDKVKKAVRERSKKNFRRYSYDFSVIVSNIERNVRVRDLKNALLENGIKPDNITWRGYKGFCYLHYAKPNSRRRRKAEEEKTHVVDDVIEVLQKMKISPESNCNLEVKVMEKVTRIETTDVTAV